MTDSSSATPQPSSTIPSDDLRRELVHARRNEGSGQQHISVAGDTYTVLLTGRRSTHGVRQTPPCRVPTGSLSKGSNLSAASSSARAAPAGRPSSALDRAQGDCGPCVRERRERRPPTGEHLGDVGARGTEHQRPVHAETPAVRGFVSTATGIRTPVSAVRGRRPSPLDDSGLGRAE